MKLKTIIAARRIMLDERTDTREYLAGPETEAGLAELQHELNEGRVRLEEGLRGWPPFTHTLHSAPFGWYHIAMEEA